MLQKTIDSAILGVFSLVFDLAVFVLRQFRHA
jgi:hypothetical protein